MNMSYMDLCLRCIIHSYCTFAAFPEFFSARQWGLTVCLSCYGISTKTDLRSYGFRHTVVQGLL